MLELRRPRTSVFVCCSVCLVCVCLALVRRSNSEIERRSLRPGCVVELRDKSGTRWSSAGWEAMEGNGIPAGEAPIV
jgi:hypothetical protein